MVSKLTVKSNDDSPWSNALDWEHKKISASSINRNDGDYEDDEK